MRIQLIVQVFGFVVLVNAQTYSQEAPIYEQAMRLLEREVQLMREFVSDISEAEVRSDSWPMWRGISNVFTDLSGMLGQGNGGRYFEAYQMYPRPSNQTEMARRARIRLEETKREIVDLNKRISEIITENFNRKPYGKDRYVDRSRDDGRLRDENREQVHDETRGVESTTEITQNSTAERAADEKKFPVPDGFVGFELPIRGLISRELLLQQLYEEEHQTVDKLSARGVGDMIRPMITKGTLNVNHGQCRIANLLDEDRMLKIEP